MNLSVCTCYISFHFETEVANQFVNSVSFNYLLESRRIASDYDIIFVNG
jgi:uncharacterized protein (DUF1330 family)